MESKKQEIQEKYMELQLLDQQIKQAQQQVQMLEQQMMELVSVKQGLDDLKCTEKGTEILAPLNSGIFVKAEIKDINDLLVNVGAGVLVQKDLSSTKGLIDNQISEIEKLHVQMDGELHKMAYRAESLQKELVSLVEEKE